MATALATPRSLGKISRNRLLAQSCAGGKVARLDGLPVADLPHVKELSGVTKQDYAFGEKVSCPQVSLDALKVRLIAWLTTFPGNPGASM